VPKFAAPRRSVATAMVAASVAALLVSSATAPPAAAVAAPGSTQRASVKDPGQIGDGTEQSPNGGHGSVISGDGSAVAFVSNSKLDNLDPGSGESQPYDNVYVRDVAHNRTVMISRGQFPDDPTRCSIIELRSKNLLSLDGRRTARLQQPTFQDTSPDGNSHDPSISADGRFVAFLTEATNIFLEDCFTDTEIVIADRDPDGDGVFDENRADGSRDYKYIRIAQSADDLGSYEYARNLKMSANATRLVWVDGEGASRFKTVGLNLPSGQIGLPVPVPSGPDNTNDNVFGQFDPAISADGNHIAGHVQLLFCECEFIHAIVSTDVRTNETTRVDIDEGGKPISTGFLEFVMHPAISADGTVIAFVAEQFENAFEGPPFSRYDEPNVYVVDVDYSRAPDQRVVRSTIASRDNTGNLINGELPGLSSDGHYLAFTTDNLAAHDGTDGAATNGSCIQRPQPVIGLAGKPLLNLNAALPPLRNAVRTNCQVVVRDLILDRDRAAAQQPRLAGTLVSPNQNGNAGNGNTVPPRFNFPAPPPPALTADGGRIAFDSAASDLIAGDTNQRVDVFVRTLEPTLRGTAVDFGPVQIGLPVARTARLEHVGAGPLPIETVSLIGPNATDFAILDQTCQGQTLFQTGSCQLTVQFTPGAVGDRRGQVQVRVRGGRVFPVDLSGIGTAQPVPRGPAFSAGPNPLTFGQRPLLSSGPESTVTVTNLGGSPLVISAVAVVGPGAPGDYAISANTCTTVQPNGQCRVTVRFSPQLPGDRTANLQFTHNAGGPTLIGLRGSAVAPVLDVNPGVTPPGRVVTVIGRQFPPGKTVTLTYTTAPGTSKATVAADGTFRADLLVFPKSKPENRTVVATVDGSPALSANDQLLIVFPTVSPADFVVRG
jgi:WD40-like Beta Propeller Repeat